MVTVAPTRLWCRRAIALALTAVAGFLAADASAQRAGRERASPPEPSQAVWVSSDSETGLLAAMERYRWIAARGGWPILPPRTTLRPGDSDTNVEILRQRLAMSGDLSTTEDHGYAFDGAVEAAVKRYQRRNGLEPTGVVYGITQRSLSVPVEARLRQLEQNLARMRALMPSLARSPRYILMNAASFELQAIENGRVAVVSRTIAGKRTTATPVVTAQLRAINILPYWHVPASIAKGALIPMIRKDRGYLARERIRVFSSFGGEEIDPAVVNWWGPEAERYVFRQDPGQQNALGVMRFDMPNKHIVYMHDTPMKRLFASFERAFSAGCVRVQNFYALAQWVAAGQDGWTSTSLAAAVDTAKPVNIQLRAPIPVHFIYLTAWIDDGGIQFRNDLYNRDTGEGEEGDETAARVAQTIAP
jgi:murein L,D-transpeptidase YcbB/YkuD